MAGKSPNEGGRNGDNLGPDQEFSIHHLMRVVKMMAMWSPLVGQVGAWIGESRSGGTEESTCGSEDREGSSGQDNKKMNQACPAARKLENLRSLPRTGRYVEGSLRTSGYGR